MRRSPLLVVYVTVFVDLLGFGIILPNLPFYALSFGATGLWIGAILTAYSAAQLVGAPLLGRVSDAVGRRPVILLSLVGSALSFTLTGLADTLFLLLLARALAGLFGGSIAAAQAYIADATPPEDRAKHMGMLGAAIGMGFVFGPALGAALSPLGFSAAAFCSAGLAAANFLFGVFALVEPRRARVPSRGRAPATSLASLLGHPYLGRLLLSTFLATFAFVGMEATFALLGERRYGLDPAGLGLVFVYVGAIVAAVQGWLVGRLASACGERELAMTGAVVMGVALVALPLSASLGLALAALGALAVGQGLVTPALSSLLSRGSGADVQGSTLGLGQSFAAGARAVGPLVAGWLFDLGAPLPYLLGAALVLVVAWLVGAAGAPPAGALASEGARDR